MSKQPEFNLPRFRKGASVEVIATKQGTTVIKVHMVPAYGSMYELKDIKGIYGEHEIRSV